MQLMDRNEGRLLLFLSLIVAAANEEVCKEVITPSGPETLAYTMFFAKYDIDGDNILNRQELSEMLTLMSEENVYTEMEILEVRKAVENAGMGSAYLSLADFLVNMASIHRRRLATQERAKQEFAEFDANIDGFIDVFEMELLTAAFSFQISETDIQYMINMLDTDEDLHVNIEEYVAWMIKSAVY